MKTKILMTIALLMFAITLNAQSSWHGFLKPINLVVQQDLQLRNANLKVTYPNLEIATSNTLLLFRPSFSLTAFALDFSQKPATISSFSSIGFGISYGKFATDVDKDKAYCYYSVNALILTSYKVGSTESVKMGGAVTADVFNKLIGAGVGYINGHVMPLVTLSYSF
jgi:hypothetical protein